MITLEGEALEDSKSGLQADWKAEIAVCLKPHGKKNYICSLESSPGFARASQPFQKAAL